MTTRIQSGSMGAGVGTETCANSPAPSSSESLATYVRTISGEEWYDVWFAQEVIGEVYKTKKGWQGSCANAPRRLIGYTKKKEELGQLILSRWLAFPVSDKR